MNEDVQKATRKKDGTCIRCGTAIKHDPEKPLCRACFGLWQRWPNVDYPEAHCHACGEAAEVTFAKPECYACFKKSAARLRA